MPAIGFGEYRPDVSDYNGQHTQQLANVLPRGDGYGPVKALQTFTAALPAGCRKLFYARKMTDGTIVIFAFTSTRIFKLDNSAFTWIPVSKVTALTSISNGSPAVFTLNSHGLSNGDTIVLSTSATLPTGLTVGTIYYVINAAANTFNVSLTSGGAAVNTSGAGSGTHSMTYVYSSLPSTDNWWALQYGNNVVCGQANSVPQAFDVTASTAFADLAGSPPTARYGAVVAQFIVLSGLVNNPNRAQWCDQNAITTWTAGTGFASSFDAPDGGIVRGVAGGEFGILFQESSLRRLIYSPGAKPAFQIERIAEEVGLRGADSIVRAGERVLFYSAQGFKAIGPTGGTVSIGKERVDRTFAGVLDTANLQLFIGAADPEGTRAFWAYKQPSDSSTSLFTQVISYDWQLDRWGPPFPFVGEFIAPLVKPAITLDALDTISTSIDALTFSLDAVGSAIQASLAGVDSSHKVGFFSGSNLEATMQTPEQSLGDSRVMVRGIRPLTDASSVFGSIQYRDTLQATATTSSEATLNTRTGVCPLRRDTRYARARVRIPAATSWNFCSGVEPDFGQTGEI